MAKVDIKKTFNNKKTLIMIGSIALNLILIFMTLFVAVDCEDQDRKGYMREWYGRSHVVEKDIFKSHTDRMKTLQHNMKNALIQGDLDIKDLRAVFKDINDEREKFNRIVEDNMIEKFSKMSLKEREKFVRNMSNRNEKFEKRSRKNNRPKMERSKEGKRPYVRKNQKDAEKKEMKKDVEKDNIKQTN